MSGPQFIRLECYALCRPRGTSRRPALDIANEALRLPGNAPHVTNPQPPVFHYGHLDGMLDEIERGAAAKTQLGPRGPQRQRKDTAVLIGGVVSFPYPPGHPAVAGLMSDSVAWLRRLYGDDLKAVLEHTDEPYSHIHFYVHLSGAPVKPLHPGYAADAQARAAGSGPRAASAAYRAGCREFQDAYYLDVAAAHGLTRLGPRRQRLSRGEWRAQQQQAESLADTRKRIQQEASVAQQNDAHQRAKLAHSNQEVHQLIQATKAQVVALKAGEAALKAREAALKARETTHAQRERELQAVLSALDEDERADLTRRAKKRLQPPT